MRPYSEENIAIYLKINEYVKDGTVVPFENSLLNYLATHTDASNDNVEFNYLNALNSTYSISKCYLFTRYLALAMNKPFRLCEGKLTSLYEGEFQHAWIETDDSVYDVAFIGKWPKSVYYDLFQPVVEKDVNLDDDKEYNHYKRNNIKATIPALVPVLKYIDWYRYMRNAQIPYPSDITLSPSWRYFPKDLDRAEYFDLISFIYNTWNSNKKENLGDIPQELLSEELSQYIDDANFIKRKKDVYKELIHFIINNWDMYEEKKHLAGDLTLWKIAVDRGYSGSLCMLIDKLPIIVNFLTVQSSFIEQPSTLEVYNTNNRHRN